MKKPVLVAAVAGFTAVLASSPALADPPKFNATCGAGMTVTSNGSGKVKVNGVRVKVKTLTSTSWRAQVNGVTLDIGRDGAQVFVSTTPGDVCQINSSSAAPNADGSIGGVPSTDQEVCLAAVSNTTNNGDVTVLSASSSEANNEVIIGVGPNKARWQCLVKKGKVANVMSLTDEGAL
ncbi:MAG: hypothetical protein JNM45_06440 [Rhizobiales bacterium]|nr:hypothetical protein [Hyphomicrobiales bacterium]